MIYINLLPVRATQKRAKLIEQMIVLVAVAAVSLVACIGVYTVLLTKVSAEQEAKTQREQESAQLQKTIGEVKRFEKLQAELRNKLGVLDQLKEGKTGPVLLLDELNKAVPDKLWLESFKESNGAISISGIGYDEETVATFMQQLEKSPYYQGVELQVIEQVAISGTKFHKFSISCVKVTPPANPKP